jgi:hypothetical protein
VRLEGNDDNICPPNILVETRSAGSRRVDNAHSCIWKTDLIAKGTTLLHPRLGRLIRIRIDEMYLLTPGEEPFRYQDSQRGFTDPSLIAREHDQCVIFHEDVPPFIDICTVQYRTA